MTIENGAEQAANDTLLQDDEIETPQGVEVEYEGKSYCLPVELKDASTTPRCGRRGTRMRNRLHWPTSATACRQTSSTPPVLIMPVWPMRGMTWPEWACA
jgi:hypothetical protein